MSDNTMQPLIRVRGLKKSFGDLDVLKGIDVDINKGDVVFVVGPSGSGKSTFLRCLNRLEEPTGGSITFEGVDITDAKTDIDKHRQRMGMVFQQFNLHDHHEKPYDRSDEASGQEQTGSGSNSKRAFGARRTGRQGGRIPEPAFRRTEAEDRDRPRTLHEAGRYVL